MAGVLEEDLLTDEEALACEAAAQQAEQAFRLSKFDTDRASSQGPISLQQGLLQAAAVVETERQPARRRDLKELLLDIEDVGTVYNRRAAFRCRGLFVTDFSASEWCQQQVAFGLSAKLPKELTETPAMQAGTERHALLEAETALVPVKVLIQTREDAFAVRLLNLVQGLRQLLEEGLTRELPICGMVQGCWVSGIIDQLDLGPDGVVTMAEQKTRFQPSLPSRCQKRTTAVQVMLYRQLYEQLAVTFSRNNASETLWPSRRLDPLLELGTAVTNHAAACGMLAANLEQMAQCLHEVAGALPKCSSVIYINYIWQGDGELLEREPVTFDHNFLNAAVARHLQFWDGQSAPQQVPEEERWKCKHCNFRSKCWPQSLRKVPWQH